MPSLRRRFGPFSLFLHTDPQRKVMRSNSAALGGNAREGASVLKKQKRSSMWDIRLLSDGLVRGKTTTNKAEHTCHKTVKQELTHDFNYCGCLTSDQV